MTAPQGPVYWHQGLFLQPQHFQLADRGTQSLLIPYQNYLAPHFWGVYRVAIRLSSIGLRSFEVSSGAFLFPDGTHVLLPENAVIESRQFQEGLLAEGAPVTVYLGLKKWQDSAENVTTIEAKETLSTVGTRFVAPLDGAPCADLHGGGPAAEVRRLSHVLRIFWESELDLLGDYLLIPLARLERSAEGVEISRQFIPPCLTITASPMLFDLVQEIRDQLAASCRRLEACKKQRGIQSAEFGSKDLVYLLALRTLNRYLAPLNHFIEARECHPWQLYGLLGQLVAEFSAFSETVSASGESAADGLRLMPEYCHLELGSCFSQAHDLILKLLQQITAGPEYALQLSHDGTYFSSDLKPAHFQGRSRFYLVLKTEDDAKLVIDSVAASGKLSSRERLPLLIAQALPGLPLEHLPNPPRELPRRASSIYFAIDSRSDQWQLVQKWSNIALCWDQAPADLEAELMIVTRP